MDGKTGIEMDRQNSWKRTEEIEIDLADLLCRLLGQWKRIFVCALIFAVVFGGYGWIKGRLELQEAESAAKQESKETDETVLTDAERQAVADAVLLQNEISGLEIYLDNSVLMQIDAYHKNRVVMLYGISHARRRELNAVTESYLSFLSNGGAADALRKSSSRWKMDKSYLAELISAYQKTYSSPYQLAVDALSDENQPAEALFYVELTGRDAKEAGQLAADLQSALQAYFPSVRKTAGDHKIKLLSEMESVTADSGLQAQQHEKKSLLSSDRTSLWTMTDAFSENQMAVYRKAAGTEERQKEKEPESSIYLKESGQGMKYIFLGLLGGALAYCGIFACWYLFSDTVKSAGEIKSKYTFPVYGAIPVGSAERKKTGRALGKQLNAYGNTQAQAVHRIRLACEKQGITRLCAVYGFLPQEQEKECMNHLQQQLRAFGIRMEAAENAAADTSAWDGLAEIGKVLLICRTGITTHRMIEEAMDFYLENSIAVSGAVVFTD